MNETAAMLAARVAMAFGRGPVADPEVTNDEIRGLGAEEYGYHGFAKLGTSGVGSPPGCYSIRSIIDGHVVFANPYLMVAGVLYEGPGSCEVGSCVLALEIPSAGMSFSCEFGMYDSVGSVRAAQMDPEKQRYVIPLYQFEARQDEEGNESVSVVCDFRSAPVSVLGEFFPVNETKGVI